ncbi:hypothetical protein CP8484711_2185, partial [Chlamydia psittaci 84-8471/1]
AQAMSSSFSPGIFFGNCYFSIDFVCRR